MIEAALATGGADDGSALHRIRGDALAKLGRHAQAARALGRLAVAHLGDSYLTAAVLSSVNKENVALVLAVLGFGVSRGIREQPSQRSLARRSRPG